MKAHFDHHIRMTVHSNNPRLLRLRRRNWIKTDDKSEEEDSEEEYEEGEFDAVGGGPTRWIRGALIGMGSFGSVYLGMNRTSGELMAVKQVELPSHEVQGEQRKQSMLIALQREIALLRDLTHENIVHYIGSPLP